MVLIASEDYPNKLIFLSADTVGVDVQPIDIYTEHRGRRRLNSNNERNFYPMVSAFGNEPAGTANTPRYCDLAAGVRIVPFDTSHELSVVGALISRADGLAGPDLFDRTPLSPSVEVDINYQPPQTEVIRVETGVSGLTAEEATLLSNLQQTIYPNATVFINTVTGFSGTTGVVGSPGRPAIGFTNGGLIATSLGYTNFNLSGILTLGPSDAYDNTHWQGAGSATDSLILSGGNSAGCDFTKLNLNGTFAGRVLAQSCILGVADGFDGIAERCILLNRLELAATATEPILLAECTSLVAGTSRPTFDVNGAASGINVRDYVGGLTVSNITAGNNCSFDFGSGTLELDSSCTSGIAVVRGTVELIDNSGPGFTVIRGGTVDELVWSKELP